jgi:hypothetical protein
MVLTINSHGLVDVERSLWREGGSVVYNCCWSSPAHSFSCLSPMGLATIFYFLSFETSLFVASYDSQGYGGGIRPRLHTGLIPIATNRLLLYSLGSDPMENTAFSCRVMMCYQATSCSTVHREHFLLLCIRWKVYTESLSSNGYMRPSSRIRYLRHQACVLLR